MRSNVAASTAEAALAPKLHTQIPHEVSQTYRIMRPPPPLHLLPSQQMQYLRGTYHPSPIQVLRKRSFRGGMRSAAVSDDNHHCHHHQSNNHNHPNRYSHTKAAFASSINSSQVQHLPQWEPMWQLRLRQSQRSSLSDRRWRE